ncbi:dihydrofolate reductase [Chryseomicrobium aureum]|uniref:dihydrofolate reductase n=1 Tax=Chryseomicrobium aureum TaxID=1441723 RepID=UPI001959B57E|nr:dihydrofolate reductase [Chryseomicrobium aureum]MBM7705606.1 dihydrofolate reductase [Chryseomicrobium aureum]
MITFIVAHDEKHVIGHNNEMPWHIPEDLKYFKENTLGRPVIMGRNTFESIGRPLPGRDNIVMTRNKEFSAEGVKIVHTFEEALLYGQSLHEEVVVIGGAKVFTEYLDYADRLLITEIHKQYEGDAFFPEYNDFILEWESPKHTSKSGVDFTYKRYSRKARE